MHRFLIISLILFGAHAAAAQSYYAEQTYPAPQTVPPQQVSGNYVGQPHYAPQQPPYAAPQPQPTAPQNQPQAGEYGQSVMTDIRQMNF